MPLFSKSSSSFDKCKKTNAADTLPFPFETNRKQKPFYDYQLLLQDSSFFIMKWKSSDPRHSNDVLKENFLLNHSKETFTWSWLSLTNGESRIEGKIFGKVKKGAIFSKLFRMNTNSKFLNLGKENVQF